MMQQSMIRRIDHVFDRPQRSKQMSSVPGDCVVWVVTGWGCTILVDIEHGKILHFGAGRKKLPLGGISTLTPERVSVGYYLVLHPNNRIIIRPITIAVSVSVPIDRHTVDDVRLSQNDFVSFGVGGFIRKNELIPPNE